MDMYVRMYDDLKRCEFDKTDYALNIVAAPAEEEEE